MSPAKRILVVDDDQDLRQMLKEQLQAYNEFTVKEAETGATAVEQARKQYFDLIVLGGGLSDMDSSAVCKEFRGNDINSPIIMLIGPLLDAENVPELCTGANDYIIKPFKINLLLSRIRSQIREHEQSQSAVFQIGCYIFIPADKAMLNKKTTEKVRLTDKETAILKYLYLADNRVVRRDILLGEVWGYNATVTTHTLETHVYRLRQKIEKDPGHAKLLVTEPNGYRLIT